MIGTALAAALGVAVLLLLLVVHGPSTTNRSVLLIGAALVTTGTVGAASVHIGWLTAVAPLAAAAAYVVAVSPRFSLPRRRNRGTARDPR